MRHSPSPIPEPPAPNPVQADLTVHHSPRDDPSWVSSSVERAREAAERHSADAIIRVDAALASGNIVYTIFLAGRARFSEAQRVILVDSVKKDLRQHLNRLGYSEDTIDSAVKNVLVRVQEV